MVQKKKTITAPSNQLGLPFTWFTGPSDGRESRSLLYWDSIPWRVLSHSRKPKKGDTGIIRFEGVRIDKELDVTVVLTAAILEAEEGSEQPRILYPGVREELVEKVLRKLAVQRHVLCRLEHDAEGSGKPGVVLVCTVATIRKELDAMGHGLTVAQIKEALDVMNKCNVKLECSQRAFEDDAGPILPRKSSHAPKEGDPDGTRTYLRLRFHPLAEKAILEELYYPINYERWMRLNQPLARWIATLLNIRYRFPEKHLDGSGPSFHLTLNRILTDSGMRKEKRMRDNIAHVRAALKELYAQGYLHWCKPLKDVEQPVYANTRGRRKIVDVAWNVVASTFFAEEIIAGSKYMKNEKGKLALPGVRSAKGESSPGSQKRESEKEGSQKRGSDSLLPLEG